MTAPRVHCEELPNGLVLLLRESHLAPVAEFQIWVRVGSADERPGEEGLAHFHEHMLFKGTETRDLAELAGAVEGVGGRVNAYTSYDVTVYHATAPMNGFDVARDVIVDMVRHSVFDATELEREIEVVLEEIRRAEDSPTHVCGEALFEEAYRVHPYRLPILGTSESVSRFDRERVLAFYERWYTATNLVVVASGDFDGSALAAELRRELGDLAPGRRREPRPVEPQPDAPRSSVVRRPFERACLELAWPAVDLGHPDTPLLDLLAFVLGAGESSRLVRRVKEQAGAVDRIDASCYAPLDAGVFGVSADLDHEQLPSAVERIVREVAQLRHTLVQSAELEKARANFLAAEHFERESVSGLARKLGSFHVIAGDWRVDDRYLGAIRAARPEDLLRVAQRYLLPEHLTVAAVLPESAPAELDGAAIAKAASTGAAGARSEPKASEVHQDELTSATRSASTGAAAARSEPKASEVHQADSEPATHPEVHRNEPAPARPALSPPRHPAPNLYSYTLPSGAELHVEPRREVPVVALRAALLGGLLAEDETRAGLTRFLSSMWLRGTRTRSAAELAEAVESIAADLDPFAGRSSVGLALEVPSESHAASLELFAEVLLEPAFAPDEIERERRDALAALARREDRLAARVFDLFAETHWLSHPYRHPLVGTKRAVESFTRDDILGQHRRLVRASNLVLGVAGDVDPDTVAECLAGQLAALDSSAFEAPDPPAEPEISSPRVTELRKERAQAHLVVGFRGLTLRDPDRFALEVVVQLLAGQGGQLFLELRDRRSLAYAVNATNVEGVAPGFFAVYIATAPEKLDEAREGIFEELRKLLDAPPDADVLERAQRCLIGNFEIDRQRSATHAAHMALDARYGLGPDADQHYTEQIAALGPEEVLRVARRVIDLDAYTMAAIHP